MSRTSLSAVLLPKMATPHCTVAHWSLPSQQHTDRFAGGFILMALLARSTEDTLYTVGEGGGARSPAGKAASSVS